MGESQQKSRLLIPKNKVLRRLSYTFLFLLITLPAQAGVTRIETISTGTFSSNYNKLIAGGESRDVTIPIPVYIIHHDQDIILFDTGLNENFKNDNSRWWLDRLLQPLLPENFKPEQSVIRHLRAQGITHVKYIILSHTHFDHASGLVDFPDTPVLINKDEWEGSRGTRIIRRLLGFMKSSLDPIKNRIQWVTYQSTSDIEPFTEAHDIFHDGSLLLISTPGHTPGQQSLLVTLESGKKYLLTGDAVWISEGYERPAPKSFLVRHIEENNHLAWESTQKIHEFHERHPEVQVVPGHDLEVTQKMILGVY